MSPNCNMIFDRKFYLMRNYTETLLIFCLKKVLKFSFVCEHHPIHTLVVLLRCEHFIEQLLKSNIQYKKYKTNGYEFCYRN